MEQTTHIASMTDGNARDPEGFYQGAVPPGLGSRDPYYGGIDRIFDAAYKDLYSIAQSLAQYSRVCQKALYWCRNTRSEVFPMAFQAACIVQAAGFPLIAGQIPLRDRIKSNPKLAKKHVDSKGFTSPQDTVTGEFRRWNYDIFYQSGRIYKYLEFYCYCDIKTAWNSQPNTILHELAHNIHYGVCNVNTSKKWSSIRESDGMSKEEALAVSKYATKDYFEFCAELISGILSGQTYPPAVVQRLFDKVQDSGDRAVQSALDRLRIAGVNNHKGMFVPGEMKGFGICAPSNIATFNPHYNNYARNVFKYRQYLVENAGLYGINSMITLATDLFCKVMNESFDFVYNNYDVPDEARPRIYNIGDEIQAYGKITDWDNRRNTTYYKTEKGGRVSQQDIAIVQMRHYAKQLKKTNNKNK